MCMYNLKEEFVTHNFTVVLPCFYEGDFTFYDFID